MYKMFRLNLCRKNESETSLLCQKIRDEVFKKHLKDPEPVFWYLTRVALDGLSCVDPLVNEDAFLVFFYQANNHQCKNRYWNLIS